jgi:tryptophanyl-tRNA synthetase
MKKVILTGLQPTSDGLHIGNYFGAIMPTLNLQGNDDNITIYLFVADLHAITNPEVKMDSKNKENLLCTYVASGFDLKKTHLFFQSDVPAHTELG